MQKGEESHFVKKVSVHPLLHLRIENWSLTSWFKFLTLSFSIAIAEQPQHWRWPPGGGREQRTGASASERLWPAQLQYETELLKP